jgi:formylglycine-generating enzyme required for sulfatase activity
MQTTTWVIACLMLAVAFSVRAEPPPASSRATVAGHHMGEAFRDCPDCPELVVISPGSIMMGSPDSEKGREEGEGPQYEVRIAYTVAVGKYPVTRGEWRQFVTATGHPKAICAGGGDWENPAYFQQSHFLQDDRHPVVCITWKDATAYMGWLSKRTGHPYRLLSEAEYEYVNRAGSTSRYFWGDSEGELCH